MVTLRNGAAILLALAIWQASARAASSPQAEESRLRETLARDYGIEAIDKTDRHAPVVLRNFVFLLKNAFPPAFLHGLKSLRYLYAYAGHDRTYDLGAYHPEEKAISIGGLLSYSGDDARSVAPRILATLAHEMGHAFLLEKLSPMELRSVSERYGGWSSVIGSQTTPDFYAKAFFSPTDDLRAGDEEPAGAAADAWKARSLCSRLATKNVHEWFAEAFSAYVLQRLGAEGLLGKGWHQRLVFAPSRPGEFWSDYNWISPAFAGWLKEKIELPARGAR